MSTARRTTSRCAVPWRVVPWRVVPAVATVLLLCVPAGREDASGAGAGAVHVTPADLASAALVGCCAVSALRRRDRPLTRRAALLLAAPVVAFAVATVTGYDPATALTGFVRYLQVFVLVPAALLLVLRSRRDFWLVAGALVLAALVQGVVGLRQYLTGTGASYAGVDIRAVGTFGPLDVMGMAALVAHGLLVLLAVALAPPPGAARWLRPAALVGAGFLVVPLVMSFSRGAWIATVVAGVAVLLLADARRGLRALGVLAALAAPAVVAVVLVGGAGGPGPAGVGGGVGSGAGSGLVGERLTSITQVTDSPDKSVSDRYTMWAAATGIWRDAPATGVGLKGFAAHRDGHASIALSAGSDTAGAGLDFQRQPLLSPHNMYLLVLSEQGLVGATAVVGTWAALLLLGLRRLRPAGREPAGEGATGGAAGRRPDACGLVAVGLLLWQLMDFAYADIGGPSTTLTAVLLGLATWWALSPRLDDPAAAAR
ncbi:O-antigen ligase family protein [Streptomyces sp. SAJ15]|uniref:O-antigen ligase family protein n=1 Tax=Streptomyces sp. SAJ15 TaxID=2011095 RepID=UPI0037DA041C